MRGSGEIRGCHINRLRHSQGRQEGIPPPFASGGVRWLLILAGLALLGAPAWAQEQDLDPEIDFWPLLYYNRDAGAGTSQFELLWPIFERSETKEHKGFYFRPLYNSQTEKAGPVRRSEFLYPLGFGTHTTDTSRNWFFPLFLTEREKSPKAETSKHMLLPFYVYRKPEDGPTDFMLFPLFAHLHNWRGRDRIVIVLWPIFTYQSQKRDKKGREVNIRHWSIIRPLFAYTRRNDGRGWKVWPIYGHTYVKGKSEKTFVLWPIYNRQQIQLDTGGTFRVLMIWPFWAQEDSPAGRVRAVLWPFFEHYQKWEPPKNGQKPKDKQLLVDRWWFPWPVLGCEKGKELFGHRFWPLYTWRKRTGERARTRLSVLWPIVWYTWEKDKRHEKRSFRVLPLIWSLRERTAKDKGETKLFQLWPLVKRERKPNGAVQWEVLSLMPLRTRQGWERNYAPFFRVYGYRCEPDGTSSHRVLWRLIRHDSGPSRSFTELWPLFSVARDKTATQVKDSAGPADRKELDIRLLKGLVGYSRAGSRHALRLLFFIKFHFGDKAAVRSSSPALSKTAP